MSEEEKNLGAGEQNATPEPELTATPDAEDDESAVDGCEVRIEDETPDEELPATEGGVV
jgi:hypothetical protein